MPPRCAYVRGGCPVIHLLTAAFMYLLAAARLPALLRSGSDAVFGAALLIGTAGLLTSPDVYVAVDQILGGRNIATLVQHSLMVAGVWNMRCGVMDAVSRRAGQQRRKRHEQIPMYLTLVTQAVFFAAASPGPTTTDFGHDYNGTLPGALFYSMVMLFSGWVCAEVAVISRRYLPRMKGAFKAGFFLVGAGTFLGAFAAVAMVLDIMAATVQPIAFFSFHRTPLQELFELIPTALVGAGLTVPAVAGQVARIRYRRWEKAALAAVAPIRDRALALSGSGGTLQPGPGTTTSEQLHRMIVQIWDAELAAGTASAITAEERAYLLAVDRKLGLGRRPSEADRGGKGPSTR